MKFKYTITGIDCPNCAAKLAALMGNIDGVDSCKINFLTEKLTIESSTPEEELLVLIKKCAHSFSGDIRIEK